MLILDVGCGTHPRGDINVDLFPNKTMHRPDGSIINPKLIKNFVRCDFQYLPFKNNTFDIVYGIHVLEHVNNPKVMLHEMLRVSKCKVFLRVPHRYAFRYRWRKRHKGHKWIFNVGNLEKLTEMMKCHSTLKVKYKSYPIHPIFTLFRLPCEIEITLFKSSEIII